MNYLKKDREEIIREYFGSSREGETPRCPTCGDVLHFETNYAPEFLQVQVDCSECKTYFRWRQTEAKETWLPLHLKYFVERYREGGVIHCPFDDCTVTYAQFSDGIMEFRCPYCNHRGRTTKPFSSESTNT